MKKVVLIILDGWGIGKKDKSDAIYSADTPYYDNLLRHYPNTTLKSYGLFVGLPDGQMGNSEVGHLNIGAGRVIYQDLVRINLAIEKNEVRNIPTLVNAYKYAQENNKAIHLIGLVSDGGVHSSEKHLYHLCEIAKDYNLEKVYVHALTDGRDCDPKSGLGFVKELEEHLANSTGKIASVCGRYYAMDRDKRWERVKVAYDLLVNGIGAKETNPTYAIQKSYDAGVTDEFILPVVITQPNGDPIATISDGDVVICFNYRTDRLRELTTVLTQQDFTQYGMNKLNLKYLTMTQYDENFVNVEPIFEKPNVQMTLGEYLSVLGLKQLRIAETEKYPHVTFFFSGGREEAFPGEDRILINSPKVPTYDFQPEMSAYLVTDAVKQQIESQKYDFICLNFANGDMVGHTGVYSAIINACEAVDKCLSIVIETAKANGYDVLLISDHGNAEITINPDGSPFTAHTNNPVPCIYIGTQFNTIKDGKLADVAPTLCKIMGIEQPKEMDGLALL
jgi:2,3-bisphosphoglycerate-independent phosphoglycerate mutase